MSQASAVSSRQSFASEYSYHDSEGETPLKPVYNEETALAAALKELGHKVFHAEDSFENSGVWADLYVAAKSGDAANLIFASKQERFIVDPTTTSEDIGPGTYNADSGEKAAQLRSPGGKVGAPSYPFASTDRRYRSHQMAPNENDIWEADLQFAAQSGQ